MSFKPYPLILTPISQNAPWGKSKFLADYLQDDQPETEPGSAPGSFWQLIDNSSLSTRVANGPLAGKSLSELTQEHSTEIVGKRHSPGTPFPVCVRLLSVGKPLPLTVHPERVITVKGKKTRPNHKFWYCIHADTNARALAGIRPRVTRQNILQAETVSELRKLFRIFRPEDGDSFFVPNRRPHALTPQILVWELSEHPGSPLTVTDWNTDEKPLETEEFIRGIENIRFSDRKVARISRDVTKIQRTRRIPVLHICPRFVVDEIRLCDHTFDTTAPDSFHLIAPVRGGIEIHTDAVNAPLKQGRIACLPAALGEYRIYTTTENAYVLRVRLQPLQ